MIALATPIDSWSRQPGRPAALEDALRKELRLLEALSHRDCVVGGIALTDYN
jgi:hypothetical protein